MLRSSLEGRSQPLDTSPNLAAPGQMKTCSDQGRRGSHEGWCPPSTRRQSRGPLAS